MDTYKKCGKCSIEKVINDFYKDRSKQDGHHSVCKVCTKQHKSNNATHIAQIKKEYRHKNRKHIRAYEKNYRKNNKDIISKINKKSYNKHKIKRKIEQKQYRAINKININTRRYKWQKEKIKTDINFKLARNIRARLAQAIKNSNKCGSAVHDLGCSISYLKNYIEQQFKSGMTWENHGIHGWHLDHIIPLSSFDLSDREQFLKACHYTNLQPLWAKDNIIKKDQIIEVDGHKDDGR